ncbi:MAG: PhoH family protein [Gammaproteobacteria bacterium]|nr:PhoH family protein [Gammaproteobacteria bacterium]
MAKRSQKQRASAQQANNRGSRKNNIVNMSDYASNLPQRSRKSKVEVVPKNVHQEDYLYAIEDFPVVFGVGPAGTGKTLLATLKAIEALKNGEIERIVITRPAVSVDEQHGFLPGSLIEKMAPWTRPIFDVFEEYYNPKQIEAMIEENVIEVAPLAYMRGRTFHNCFVIADEIQLTTPNQMKMLLTRLGQNSTMVLTGDLEQADRTDDNGLRDFLAKVESTRPDNIEVIRFDQTDIERSEVVEEVLKIYNK